MSVELTLPKLGVEMEEARLVEWLVDEGASVSKGQSVATVETEKVQFELEAPSDGLLQRVAEADVDYVVGDLLGRVAQDQDEYSRVASASGGGDGRAAGPGGGAQQSASEQTMAASSTPATDDVDADRTVDAAIADGDPAHRRRALAEQRRGEPLASPVARRMAAAQGIDLARVEPSGARGVIRKRDVERARQQDQQAPPVRAEEPATATEAGGRTERLSSMRRTIAVRMHRSLHETAQMTDVREQDVSRLVELRNAAVDRAEGIGYRVSYTDLMVKAIALTLVEVPELNAHLEDDHLTVFDEINIGVAVAIPEGLIVPVVRGADRLGIRAIHEQVEGLVERARERRTTPEDSFGGTFTLTNFGSYGSHFGTPILTPGQVGILGTGALLERPVVRDGELGVGVVMHTSLTVDHRAVDGASAGRFQTAIGELLGDPERLLYG